MMNYHWEGVAGNSALDLIKLQAAFLVVGQNLVCSRKAGEAWGHSREMEIILVLLQLYLFLIKLPHTSDILLDPVYN